MPDSEIPRDKISKFLSSFTTIGLVIAIAFLSMVILGFASRIESLAPAEFQILINILKNRFFR